MTPEEEEKRRKCEAVKAKQRVRREAGLCRYCDSPPVPGLTSCERHLRARSRNWKRVSKNRKTAGLCCRCNEPRVEGSCYCSTHLQYMASAERKRAPGRKAKRDERRSKGLCHYCDDPAEQGRVFCSKHAEYFRAAEHTESRRVYRAGKGRFTRARSTAIQRMGAESWTLTREQYDAVVARPCDYCGFPNEGMNRGLDRLDNSRGYHLDNVVSCCTECNVARGDNFSPQEMRSFIGPSIRAAKLSRLSADQIAALPAWTPSAEAFVPAGGAL